MSEKLLPCPFCGGEARTFEYDGANQATCGGKHIDCAGTDVVAPVAMWNRRTPAPEGEACPTCNGVCPEFCSNAFHLASPVVPAPEGEVTRLLTYANSHKLPDEEPIGVTNLKWGDLRAFAGKPLYASPAVPVGSGEPVARATCQDCGGHIEGWICQSCDRQFRENDAGDLVFEDQPVFPVGVSREEIARIIDPWAFSVVGNIMHTERASEDRDKALAKADAILAALRPADTGANHD